MKEPAIRPLTIEPDTAPELHNTVNIEALTPEAVAFIKMEAARFGRLYMIWDGRFDLWVHKGCNRAEVVEYLNALWARRLWPSEIETEGGER